MTIQLRKRDAAVTWQDVRALDCEQVWSASDLLPKLDGAVPRGCCQTVSMHKLQA